MELALVPVLKVEYMVQGLTRLAWEWVPEGLNGDRNKLLGWLS
jgi:hypothetical protein